VIPFDDGYSALVLPDQFWIDDVAILVTPQGEVGATPYNSVGISAESSLSAIAAVDLNGDGQPDVVTTESYSSAPVAVMLSQGGTQFKAPVKYPLAPNPLCSPCAGPAAMAIGDFNGDGKPDVLVGNAGFPNTVTAGLVSVLLGNGDGTLKAAIPTSLPSGSPAGQYSSQIFALGDFNRDGKLDVAVAGYGAAPDGSGAGSVILLLGKGDGTFETPVTLPVPSGLHPVAVAAADFNGDGVLDLAVALIDKTFSGNPETLAIFLGEGNSAFGPVRTFALQSLAGAAGAIAIGDLNGDGKLDLAVSSNNAGSDLIDILLGDGAGGFQAMANPPGTYFYAPIPMAIADVNGDGAADIVAGGPEGAVFLGNGDGTFQPEQYFSSGFVAGMATTRFAASNGPDLVIANPAGTWVPLVNNYLPPTFFAGEAPLGSGVYYLQFPDGNLFGYYTFVTSSIFYHYDMGYEAFIPGSASDTYLYDFTSGHWWYTSSSLFPYLYDFTLKTFIYYFPNTTNPGHYTANPRYFSNLTTGKIFTM
jgi:hypothetical protein